MRFCGTPPPMATLESLSVIKLKKLAHERGVSLTGCFEKHEIVAELHRWGVRPAGPPIMAAPAPAPPPARRPSPPPQRNAPPLKRGDLEAMKISQLREIARKVGSFRSRVLRAPL